MRRRILPPAARRGAVLALAAAALVGLVAGSGVAGPGDTTLVSVDSSGNQANYGSDEKNTISADGRHVAFYSGASNLVESDTNNRFDIFVRELLGSDCTITGTRGDDLLEGTEGDDTICGLGGDDTIKGMGSNDKLRGGYDYDTLEGGEGEDKLEGGVGSDTAFYKGSPTAVSGSLATNSATSEGTDTFSSIENLEGSSHDDELSGSEERANRLTGLGGADALRGFGGTDSLSGGGGSDTLKGGEGNDKIVGHWGRARLSGEAGEDALDSKDGVSGNDSLDGGEGTDSCTTDPTEASIAGCL